MAFVVSIDFSLFEKIYGKPLTDLFHRLGIIDMLDVNVYYGRRKIYPNIGSIWLYGKGTFENNDRGIDILNGTLLSVKGFEIPYGDDYYKKYFARDLMHEHEVISEGLMPLD